MPIITNEYLTPREQVMLDSEKEESAKSRAHEERMRTLELEVRKEEAKWSTLFRLPILIIKLPVMLVLGIGYIIDVSKGQEPSKEFWEFLR